MIGLEDLEQIERKLDTAQNFTIIFGPLPSGTVDERKSALRKSFAYLAQTAHEDRVLDALKPKAKDVFRKLDEMWNAAKKAVENGIYDKPFSKKANNASRGLESFFELQSKIGSFRFSDVPYRYGDFSILYRGTVLGSNAPVIAKIAGEPSMNGWLEKEASILAQFRDARMADPLFGIKQYVPHLLDTFIVFGNGGKCFRANVMKYEENMVTATELRKLFPDGVEPKHAAWIWRRILSHTLAASMAGVVAGAIVPDHVLVEPVKHHPYFIGWAHSVPLQKRGQRITHIIDRWKDFYPPEVFNKEVPTHKTDVYMAGMCMLYLLGAPLPRKVLPKSIPERLQKVILSCVEEKPSRRPQNGKVVLDEFSRVVWDIWGKVYRPLTLPVH